MYRSRRYTTSLLMTMIYLLIVFSPLATLAMQSKLTAHAVGGKCSGDCRIDGCSPERRATHTCCCWQSRKKTAGDVFSGSAGGCCGTKPTPAGLKTAGHCPSTSEQAAHDNHQTASATGSTTQDSSRPASIGTHPCGSGKHIAFWGTENVQHLPYHFTGEFILQLENSTSQPEPERKIYCHKEPPDPPPRRSLLS